MTWYQHTGTAVRYARLMGEIHKRDSGEMAPPDHLTDEELEAGWAAAWDGFDEELLI